MPQLENPTHHNEELMCHNEDPGQPINKQTLKRKKKKEDGKLRRKREDPIHKTGP